jgi:hypothetical protein
MLRIGKISEVMQTRTLRVVYGNTQAYPWAGALDPNVYNGITGTKGAAFTPGGGSAVGVGGQGPIWPGQVGALASNGLTVCVYTGNTGGTANATNGLLPLGLFGNFVGGDFDEVGDYTEVGVWKGPGSWYEVLSPVFNTTTITSTNASGYGSARLLWADTNGLLSASVAGTTTAGNLPAIAELGSYTPAKITVGLFI